ncbi:ABC transporter substrate-binding protein, partial [Chloroflexota bacterium]
VFNKPPYGMDDGYSTGAGTYTMNLTNDKLLGGDWAKGSAGTGETNFMISTFNPNAQAGILAESWEIPDPNTVVFHIRKGIHWHDKPPVNGRELTADDVALTFARASEIPSRVNSINRFPGWFESATATDKYTVVIKGNDTLKNRTTMVFEGIAENQRIVPRDAVEKYGDLRDWRNSCGTGPFMLVDAVPGSSYTLVKNPNYWRKDPLHPENQLPYLDGATFLEIIDVSTRIAAVRTGKVDSIGGDAPVAWEDAKLLMKTNPELKLAKGLRPRVWLMFMRLDRQLPWAPQDDPDALKVRRALHMAIDFNAIKDELYNGEGSTLTWPVEPFYPHLYTPIEELPEPTRELFEYHPDKAKELLAEAGYPNGFKCNIVTYAETDKIEMLSIVKDYWSKIGVDLEIRPYEYAVAKSIQMGGKHEHMIIHHPTLGKPYRHINTDAGSAYNLSMVDDPYINERLSAIWAHDNAGNEATRAQLVKELTLQALTQAYVIQLPVPVVYTFWQPWVQNYHGESSIGYQNFYSFVKYIWLDQDLKQEMTGRR